MPTRSRRVPRVSQDLRGWTAITSLARPLDLRVASNRFAVFWTLVSFLTAFVAWLLNDEPLGDAVVGGLQVGIGAFLAWALGRELDPDRPASARWAGMLALLFAAILGPPALLPCAVVMVMARVFVRTAGLPLRATDLLALVAGAILASSTLAGAVAALVLATALVLDLRHEDTAGTGPVAAAAIAIIAGGGIRLVVADPLEWVRPEPAELVVGVLVLVALVPGRVAPLLSRADGTGLPLDPARLAVARRLTLLVAPIALLIGGRDEVTRLSPVVAGLVGLGLETLRRNWTLSRGRE